MAVKRPDAPELSRPVTGPPCPRHAVPMAYSVERGAWMCTVQQCHMLSWPNTEMTGKPILGKGPVTFIKQGNRIWAKADNNVMVELTDVLTAMSIGARRPQELRLGIVTTNIIEVPEG